MDFIGSGSAQEEAFTYMADPNAIAATADIMEGLDAAMTSEDRNMVEYYKKYVKDQH